MYECKHSLPVLAFRFRSVPFREIYPTPVKAISEVRMFVDYTSIRVLESSIYFNSFVRVDYNW